MASNNSGNGGTRGNLRALGGKGIARARQDAEQLAHAGEEVAIKVREDLAPEVRFLGAMIAELERLAMAQRQALRNLLRHGHGIDIAQPGWRVDTDAGIVARIPSAPSSAPAAAPEPEPPAEA